MSTSVHPTALVDPKSELDDQVEVGPYSIIGAEVRIGKGSIIGPQVLIENWVRIGKGCTIAKGVVIGTLPQDTNFEGKRSFVEIGDDNIIREYTTIHRGSKAESVTRIGNETFLMAYSHVAHNCMVEDGVVVANMGTLAGHVTLEKKVMVGGLSAIHQYVKVGAYSIIGGCSKVIKDIPPYTRADGHPATLWGLNSVGLRRANFSPEKRQLLKRAYKILFRSGLNTSRAIKQIENELELVPEIRHLCEFVTSSDRGICKEKRNVAL